MTKSPTNTPATDPHDSASPRPQVIFFGNGPLADSVLEILKEHTEVIFHAHSQADLAEAARLKKAFPEAFGVLASFGVLIKSSLLELFEPEGIINLHPSKLPQYRGASPIESAILAGDTSFSYSIMKLVKAMDAGPLYHQATLDHLPLNKSVIYDTLAKAGAEWLVDNFSTLRKLTPVPQDDSKATFTTKLDKSMSLLGPSAHTAEELFRQIVAYQNFPKPKYEFFGKTCIILEAHVINVVDILCESAGLGNSDPSPLMLKCRDRNFVAIDRLQPEGKKPMDVISFMNGYCKS